MTESKSAGQEFSSEQLGRLHSITQQVEKVCRTQLWSYLDAMAPLFRARRVLGNHMEGAGKETVSSADQALNELREVFIKACGRPFDLRKELTLPLESVPTQLQLHQWEYLHEIPSDKDRARDQGDVSLVLGADLQLDLQLLDGSPGGCRQAGKGCG